MERSGEILHNIGGAAMKKLFESTSITLTLTQQITKRRSKQ
jgi:hypothetical protein